MAYQPNLLIKSLVLFKLVPPCTKQMAVRSREILVPHGMPRRCDLSSPSEMMVPYRVIRSPHSTPHHHSSPGSSRHTPSHHSRNSDVCYHSNTNCNQGNTNCNQGNTHCNHGNTHRCHGNTCGQIHPREDGEDVLYKMRIVSTEQLRQFILYLQLQFTLDLWLSGRLSVWNYIDSVLRCQILVGSKKGGQA